MEALWRHSNDALGAELDVAKALTAEEKPNTRPKELLARSKEAAANA